MRDTVVAGIGMTDFRKFPDRDAGSLAREAAAAAMADAGLEAGAVQMVFFSNAAQGLLTGQEMIRGQVMLSGSSLEGKPLVNVENACASGSSAFFLAWIAVASGAYDVALAVGAEKLAVPEKERAFAALMGGVDVARLEELRARIRVDDEPGQARSLFMDIYAAMARAYMERTGATELDFARVSAKNHAHGALNARAQYREAVSPEEVLASRRISGPLTLLMCAPIGDGAAAALVCSSEVGHRLRPDVVRVRGIGMATGQEGGRESPVERAARAAYEASSFGPEDLDVVEVHDATSPAELIAYEELGLCVPEEGPRLLATGATRLGGRVPVNPSGGLLSKGHPVGATGLAQIVELVEQLQGRSGQRQVEGARVALAENAGGYLHPHPAAATVTVLSR